MNSYVKNHLRVKNVDSVNYTYRILKLDTHSLGYYPSTPSFNLLLRYAQDPQYVITNYDRIYSDISSATGRALLQRAVTLGDKIDWSLSKTELVAKELQMGQKMDKLFTELKLVEEFYSYAEEKDTTSSKMVVIDMGL